MSTNQLSRDAFERLSSELQDLTTRGRIDIANKIEEARLLGDVDAAAGGQVLQLGAEALEGVARELVGGHGAQSLPLVPSAVLTLAAPTSDTWVMTRNEARPGRGDAANAAAVVAIIP